ncbi:hypothetical protein [Erwinia billingiae]|uniref:hypothetical protein n=1 Tax=Erwinia billingiae TaxID=182337 RepID=UPI0005A229C4|nr:hypothetical protein [Erwinia billingiae]
MKVSSLKWFFIFIYLMISLPGGVFISAITIQILIRLFFFFSHGLPLDLSSIDYVKIFKGSIGGGVIGAIGCWWIYYQYYKKDK